MVVESKRQKFVDYNDRLSDPNMSKIKAVSFDDICDYAEKTAKKFKSFLVVNEKGKPRFKIDEEFRVIYKTSKGEIRCADITDYAFSQLCAQLGLPAQYVRKCFDYGKPELALANFRAWSGDIETNLVFKEYQGVIRGVVSERYKSFSNNRVCDTLRKSVDFDRYMPIQANIQPESMAIRFIEKDSVHISGDRSPIWNGFMISNNDVGGGSLKITDFMYRQWCTNGMTTQIFKGDVMRKSHRGEDMSDGKIIIFSKAIQQIADLKDEKLKLIDKSSNRKLSLDEYQMLTEKVSARLKLSEKASEELDRISHTYAENGLTEWSVINGVAELAQQFTLDKRMELESYAGTMLTRK